MRGLGGQKAVRDLMMNHYSSMLKVKPTLDTRAPPPKHINAKSGRQSLKTAPPQTSALYGEQREAYRRVAVVKGNVDCGAPTTFVRQRTALIKNRAANKNNFEDQQHLRNLAALRDRIQNVGNHVDRRKNIMDPVAHPVKLFRHNRTDMEKVSLKSFNGKIAAAQKDRLEKERKAADDWILAHEDK